MNKQCNYYVIGTRGMKKKIIYIYFYDIEFLKIFIYIKLKSN